MAENTENTGGSLDQVAVEEVAQPQVEATEVSVEPQAQQEPQSGEKTADSQTDEQPESAESMDLDKLEEKLSGKTSEQTPEEPKVEKTKPEVKQDGESQALTQENKQSRSENRYQELANRNRELEQKIATMEKQSMGQLAQEAGIPLPPWEKEKQSGKPEVPPLNVQPGSELTPEQYQQHVAEAAEKMAAAKVAAYELQAQDRIERQQQVLALDESMNYIKNTYPELDPNHPNYSQELDEMVGQIVQSMGQVNPSAIKERVDQVMKLRGQSLQAGQAQANSTLAQQMAESAVIPNSPVNEPKTDLSKIDLDDLEEQLGSVS